jgi:hypothetical protein
MTKNQSAVLLGRRGGKARAKSLSASQRSLQARRAVQARWAKLKESKEVLPVVVPVTVEDRPSFVVF